jgi:uncharacterized protein YaiL (DUF2058 family)
MKLSLRDQLLQAGLINKGQARVAEQHKRRVQNKKQRGVKSDDPNASVRASAQQAAEAQRARDRALNQKRLAKQKAKEERTRLSQLLQTHRLNDPHAPRPYRFQVGKQIKTIYITEEQFTQLMRGQLVVLTFEDRLYILTSEIAERALAIRPNLSIHRIEPEKALSSDPSSQSEEDPYAQFAVPDDLIW